MKPGRAAVRLIFRALSALSLACCLGTHSIGAEPASPAPPASGRPAAKNGASKNGGGKNGSAVKKRLKRLIKKPDLKKVLPKKIPNQPPIIEEQTVHPPKALPPEFKPPEAPRLPWIVRWMIHPMDGKGMFIGLPIVDTNPNRGVTFGVMPIWVLNAPGDPRIRHIHAPSLTYNKDFNWIPTYRYYFYPTAQATYQGRVSISKHKDRELMGLMNDANFLGRGLAFNAKAQYDVDGSKRFYGIGPDTPSESQSNFTRKIAHYYGRLGVPLFRDTGLRWNIAHHFAGEAIEDGVIGSLPSISRKFPGTSLGRWRQDSEVQLFIDYDTRDNDVTTSSGTYVKFMIENSQKAFASDFVFQRYGIDLRHFYKPAEGSRHAAAVRFLYEQLVGDAPFYLMPQLGGKYVHRGYGEGRYIDKGMMTSSFEERFKVYEVKVTGVTTEIQVAPFVELGTVFNDPKRMARRYLRPVVGSAFRAIARPQVVGSVDVGVSQEGPAVFMDINYSF